jgi:integrase
VTVAGTVAEARSERRRLLAAGRPATVPAPEVGTVHGLAADWFRAGSARWSPGTLSLRDHAYRERVAPRFAEVRLADLSRPAVEAWAAQLVGAGHGRRAVETAVQTLRAMLAVALEAGMIATNPAARVRLPPAPPAERTAADRVLDRPGAERLIAAAWDVRQETILRAALECGLRRGEVCGLAWPDVRLEERRLVVRQAVYQNATVGKVVRQPRPGGDLADARPTPG